MGIKKVFYLDPDERKWTLEDLGLHMNDVKDLAYSSKKIEGIFFANKRKIIESSDALEHCSTCLELLEYNDEFDSSYCGSCNEWREFSCADPDCEYCLERPEKPSDCK
ncbi:hypothetical protein ACXYMX_01445 [Sporosarcina sp. CAU 1771]